MIKKYSKLFVLAFVVFFASMVPAFARTLSLEELEKELHSAEINTDNAIIIGQYAFTGKHSLTTQDIMLAARSIQNNKTTGATDKDQIYQQMTITSLTYDIETDKWSHKNIIGEAELDESSLIINYIDYDFLKTPTEATVDLTTSSENQERYKNLIESTYGFTGGNEKNSEELTLNSVGPNEYKLTGLLKKFDGSLTGAGFSQEDLTGYYFSYFIDFKNKALVNENSTITIRVVNQNGEEKPTSTKTFHKTQFDSDTGIAMLFAYKPTDVSEYQKIEITLDYDGEQETYKPVTYTIDLSELRVPTLSNATMSKEIPQADLTVFSSWNYTMPDTVTYTPEGDTLKLGGILAPQDIDNEKAKFSEDDAKGYYVLVNFNSKDFIPGKTTIKMKKGEGSEKELKSEIDETGVSVLIALNPGESNKEIKVIVDLDGNGNEYLPKEYTIDWKDLTLEKKTEVKALKEFSNSKTVSEVLSSTLHGYDSKNIEKVSYSYEGNTLKVTGILPQVKNVTGGGFSQEDYDAGYFLPFVISLTEEVKDTTTVSLSCRDCEGGMKTQTGKTGWDTTKEALFIASLREKKEPLKIIIDLDGEETEYAPYEIILDYSGLTLQKETIMNKTDVKATIPEGTDKEHFEDVYGYEFKDTLSVDMEGNVFKISGQLHEQEINEDVFNETESTNFYIPYNINPTGAIKGKTTVTRPINQGKDTATSVINDEYGSSVLLSIQPEKIESCKQSAGSCQFEITVDLDGNEDQYMPSKFIIDYSGVTLIPYRKVTFQYPNGNKEINVYQGEMISKSTEGLTENPTKDYHEFIKWTDQKGQEFKLDETVVAEDITLSPNWKVNIKNYVENKVSLVEPNENYQVSMGESETINFKIEIVQEKEVLKTILTDMLKGILEAEDVKVTLTLESSNQVITKVDELSSKLDTLLTSISNLDDLISKEISIKFEKVDNALVELEENNTYKMAFTADYRKVTNNETLKSAIEDANKGLVKNIIIADSFTVSDVPSITKDVTISGISKDKTLTGTSLDKIFSVNDANVKIENLKLADAKSAITVQSGNLTVDSLEFTTKEGPAIEVLGGSLTGTNLTYSGEKYDYPLVKAKNNSTINVIAGESKLNPTKKEKIEPYLSKGPVKENQIGEKKVLDEDYNNEYTNYYLNSEVANRWIKMNFVSDRSVTSFPTTYTLYFDKEKDYDGHAPEPDDDIEGFTMVTGKVIVHKLRGWKCTNQAHSFHEKGNITPLPTEEVTYYADYIEEYNTGVKKVSGEEDLKGAIAEAGQEEKIVIVLEKEISLTDVLDINQKNIIITGVASGTNEIKGGLKGKIKVSANDITFEKINVTGSSASTGEDLVEVTGTDFRSDHVTYSSGDGNYTNMINFKTTEEPVETILYFNKFNLQNASVGINFEKEVKGNTGSERDGVTITGNDFDDSGAAVTFIKVKNITSNTTLNIAQSSVVMKNDDTYLLQVDASPSTTKETFYFTNIWTTGSTCDEANRKIKVKIDANNEKDASGIVLEVYKTASTDNVKVDYDGEPTVHATVQNRQQ